MGGTRSPDQRTRTLRGPGLEAQLALLRGAEAAPQYLRTRLRRAGCERDLFTAAAVLALHEAVGGAMRELDHLAQAVLREAARHKRRLIDGEHIQTLLQATDRRILVPSTPV